MKLDAQAPKDCRYGTVRCACGRVCRVTGTLSTPQHRPRPRTRGPWCPDSLRPVRLSAVVERP